MKLTFTIDYFTKLGEQVFVVGSVPELGNGNEKKALKLDFDSRGYCHKTIDIKKYRKKIHYKYFVKNSNEQQIVYESGNQRSLAISNIKESEIIVKDFWRFLENKEVAHNSLLFTKVLHQRISKRKSQQNKENTFQLQVNAPSVSPNETLLVTGNNSELGNWNIKKAIELTDEEFPIWKTTLKKTTENIHYKYIVKNKKTGEITWENGENRTLEFSFFKKNKHLIYTDEKINVPINLWRGAGVSIPVFSIRTNNGYGTGEFLDLKELVDWTANAGMNIIQLLPINDTTSTKTWLDSYPYKPISVVALHPMYLNVRKLTRMSASELKKYNSEKEKLNKLKFVDYEKVNDKKWKYVRAIFSKQKKRFLQNESFQRFFTENKEWLQPYAVFCYLRDVYKTTDFSKWGKYANFKKSFIKKLTEPKSDGYHEIALHYYVQYHLHLQLSEVVKYAHRKNVALKGDIPIGIGGESVDAWTQPQLFNLGTSAGAPPDAFATQGQNWGFPTYNWKEMEKDQFSWWKTRFQKMADYFSAYRIDHILGFFRIWEIPENATWGLLGHFNKAIPYSTHELEQQGITFDYERFCKPYIKEHILSEVFGKDANLVKELFLTHTAQNSYEFKKDFNSQKKIINHFKKDLKSGEYIHIKEGLMSLFAEIIFIPDPINPALFHPRISMQNTLSFRDLDHHTKHKLNKSYDYFFYHRHNDFWKQQAMTKLPELINSNGMLVCGEDLGMVPDCVNSVMNQLHILSLEIQRMPKDSSLKFAHPANAPYLSVCTTSTHDMSTVRGWWEENKEESQEFYNTIIRHHGEAPFYAEPWLCTDIIKQHLYSPAMLTIFPLQDLLAIDGSIRNNDTHEERINEPSNSKHHWKYRMHLSVEQLKKSIFFNKTLKALIEESDRNTNF